MEEGFDFLGQTVRRFGAEHGLMLIRPSRKSQKAFRAKVHALVRASKPVSPFVLIQRLNPLIVGWAMYHRHVASARVFKAMDQYVFECLWRWACRRHPQKGKRWVKRHYFVSRGRLNWVFLGAAPKAAREQRSSGEVWLRKMSKVGIRRHMRIRGAANPYDPAWEPYFEQRLGVKMAQNLRGRRMLRRLWREQQGICPLCGQKITLLTGWHSHHLVWRVMGGSDDAENRLLLHPECHRQLHRYPERFALEKPRPADRGVGEA